MMKRLIRNLRQRLSLRLGLIIVLIITVVFSLLFGFLLYRCKRYIQRVAIDRATQLLDNTVVRINGIMDETELVTNFMAQTTPRHLLGRFTTRLYPSSRHRESFPHWHGDLHGARLLS